MNNRGQTKQEQDQQNQDQPILNPQDFFPRYINSYMLSFLNYSDINRVIPTSKYWQKCAIEARYMKNLTEQLELLEGDELWKILPQANNQTIVNEFFKKNLLMPGQEEELKKLDEFKNLESNDILNALSGEFSSTVDKFKTGIFIPVSNFLLELKERLQIKNFDHPTSLINFLNFPLEYEKQQYDFFLSYLKLVRAFSLLRFGIQIVIHKKNHGKSTTDELLNIMLANPSLSRNMPMSSCFSAGGIIKKLLDRLYSDKETRSITTWLKELTIQDWILFLTSSTSSTETFGLFGKFLNAFPHLHLSNKNKTKFKLLYAIAEDAFKDFRGDRTLIVVKILASELVLEIDSKTIIKLIEAIDIESLEQILRENTRIVKKFDLEAAINFVKVDSRKALALLKNINFLNKLNLNDLLKIFENLHSNTYREYLDCNELKIRLNTEDRLLRSHFLYKVINLHIGYFSNHSPRAFEMLEISHLIHLGRINSTIKILDVTSLVTKMNSLQLAQLTSKRRVNDIAANYLHLFNDKHFKLFLKTYEEILKTVYPNTWKKNVLPEIRKRHEIALKSEVIDYPQSKLKVETKIFDLGGKEITPIIKKEETGDQTCRYTLYDKDNEIGFLDLSIGHTSEDLADFVNIKHKVVSHEYNQAELALNEIVLQVCLNENKQSVHVFPSSAKDILFYYGQGYRQGKWGAFSWDKININDEELGVKAYLKWKYKKLIINDNLNQFLQKYTFEKEVDNLKLDEYDPISLERYTFNDLCEFFYYLYQNKTTQEFREKLCLIISGFNVFSLILPREMIAAKKQQRLLLRNQNIPEDTTSTEEATQGVSRGLFI